MNQFLSTLFLTILSAFVLKGQTCIPNGITFSSQQSIDNFSINYPDCSEIGGDVIIGISAIRNFGGLKNIKHIHGDFVIQIFNEMEDFSGLDSLQSIGGSFRINLATDLINFNGLNQLREIGGAFIIKECERLQHFSGLEQLQSIGGTFSFGENQALTNVNGLNQLNRIGQNLIIKDNSNLSNLSGFDKLQKLGGFLEIDRNRALLTLNTFNQLDTLSGGLKISSNQQLVELNGFSNLKKVGGTFIILANSSLKHITGFETLTIVNDFKINQNQQITTLESFANLQKINGSFTIFLADSLQNLKGFEQVDSIQEFLFIVGNDNLVTLEGLNNLKYVGGYLSISVNRDLQDIKHLKQLHHIKNGLYIRENESLETLEGLENIPANFGQLWITDNESLSDISAIANLDPIAISELIIRENPNLATCEETAICRFLELVTDELVIIEKNASGCLSRNEVSISCGIDYALPMLFKQKMEWNWASHLKRTAENAQVFPTKLFTDSQNNNYLVGRYSSNTFFDNQILDFSDRIGSDNNSFIAKYDAIGNLIWTKRKHIGKRFISATIDAQDIIHVFAADTVRGSNAYLYEQYDTDWQQLSSVPLFNYDIGSGALTRPQIAVDKADNRYFLFRGDGWGSIKFLGLADTLQLPSAHNYWLLKYTPEGELAWLDTLQSGGFVNIEMDFNEENELTLAGTYHENFSVQQKTLPGGIGSARHIFCLQYTIDGSLKWARTFGEGTRLDYCNDLVVKDDFVYLTGTLGFGDYILGEDSVSVLIDDPFLFKLDNTGEVVNHLVLPINATRSKGVSLALNAKNEIIWIGKYAGKNAIINETFLPHKADYVFQQHTFVLTIEQLEDFQITAIHTIESLGTYEIPEIIPLGDSTFLAAGYFSQDIILGDTSFVSDFSVSNRYDAFVGVFGLVDTSIVTLAYTPLVVENATWILYNSEDDFTINTYWAYKIQGDTIVDGINYKKLHYYELEKRSSNSFNIISQKLEGILREDKTERKVYARLFPTSNFFGFGTCSDSEEQLILDFNKTINEAFDDCHAAQIGEAKTILKDTIIDSYGQLRRALINEGAIQLIEGIGYNKGLFLQPTSLVHAGYGYGLLNYCQDINFNCNLLTAITDPLPQKVRISPNPTSNFLNLRLEQFIEGQIELKSISGQIVYTANFKGINHQISVRDLPKGLYFLYLQSEEGYLIQKVIIQ